MTCQTEPRPEYPAVVGNCIVACEVIITVQTVSQRQVTLTQVCNLLHPLCGPPLGTGDAFAVFWSPPPGTCQLFKLELNRDVRLLHMPGATIVRSFAPIPSAPHALLGSKPFNSSKTFFTSSNSNLDLLYFLPYRPWTC